MPLQRQTYFSVSSEGVPIRNIADYSPFGVQLDGRTIQGDFYRRGFNGMEKDDDVKGGGNSYDFGARMYDARVGRWLSVDALASKYPFTSPYCYVTNTPIQAIDPDGKRVVFPNQITVEKAKNWLNEIGLNNEFRINRKGVLKKQFTPFKKNDELTKEIYKKIREIHVNEISYTESLNWKVESLDIPNDRDDNSYLGSGDINSYLGCGNMVVVAMHFEPAPIITYLLGKCLTLYVVSKDETEANAKNDGFIPSEASTFIGLLLDESGNNSKFENQAREKIGLEPIKEQIYDVGQTSPDQNNIISSNPDHQKVINRDENGGLNDYSSKRIGHR